MKTILTLLLCATLGIATAQTTQFYLGVSKEIKYIEGKPLAVDGTIFRGLFSGVEKTMTVLEGKKLKMEEIDMTLSTSKTFRYTDSIAYIIKPKKDKRYTITVTEEVTTPPVPVPSDPFKLEAEAFTSQVGTSEQVYGTIRARGNTGSNTTLKYTVDFKTPVKSISIMYGHGGNYTGKMQINIGGKLVTTDIAPSGSWTPNKLLTIPVTEAPTTTRDIVYTFVGGDQNGNGNIDYVIYNFK